MLKDIAQKYQFNIIRIYPAWSYYNPAPDKFNFDDVEEVLKYCDEFGLRVLMGIVLEEAPYWLERLHPETRYVDATGKPQHLGDSPNNVSGGWPGLCFDWEPVQQAAAQFVREICKLSASHPSMYAYDCWNEVHVEPAWARNMWGGAQFTEAQPPAIQFRVPKGIYTNFVSEGAIKQAQAAAYPTTKPIDIPSYPVGPVDPTDPVLVNYFTTLLNNPVIAGLAPQIKWLTLNPSKGVYTWNLLDDVFTAVHQWDTAHPNQTQKTIQLLIAPGFSSPDFVFSDIDTSVCGEGSSPCPLAGSCDGLFMSPQPAVSQACGYTTLFYETEAGAPMQENLPMPWNAVYKSDQEAFLMALNEQINRTGD